MLPENMVVMAHSRTNPKEKLAFVTIHGTTAVMFTPGDIPKVRIHDCPRGVGVNGAVFLDKHGIKTFHLVMKTKAYSCSMDDLTSLPPIEMDGLEQFFLPEAKWKKIDPYHDNTDSSKATLTVTIEGAA